MSKTTRWPAPVDFAVDGLVASPPEEEEDEDDDDGGLLSSRTTLVPMPAFDHAETVLQCFEDIVVVVSLFTFSYLRLVST